MASASASAQVAFVVDVNNNLFVIDMSRSAQQNSALVGELTGLTGSGEHIAAMDFRPSTGGLYAISDQARLYLIDAATARVTLLHAFAGGELGTFIRGADFDPRADRLRVMSRGPSLAKSSYLVDPDTFAVTTQNPITGLAEFEEVFGVAYAGNVAGAASSTMYVITDGSAHHRLARIGNVNDTTGASQAAGVATPVIELGISPSTPTIGFDITASGDMFMAAKLGTANNLYWIDPSFGAVLRFTLNAPQLAEIRAFAIYSVRQKIDVLTSDNKLVVIDSAAPWQPAAGLPQAPVPFVGLQPGEQIMAIDVRPMTGELYGFSDQSRLYRIAPPTTASATTAVATMVGSGPLPIAATSQHWEMDFDVRYDRLRVARVQPGAVFTINPNDGTLDNGHVFNFDPVGLAMPMQVGPLVPSMFMLDRTNGDLDILESNYSVDVQRDAAYLTQMNTHAFDVSPLDNTVFYAANRFGELFTTLFTLDLVTAELRTIGAIFTRPTGPQISVRSIAVASPGVLTVPAAVSIGEAAGTLAVFVDRVNGTNGPITVNCRVTNGTATQPDDFGAAALVRIPADASRGSCIVPIVNDTLLETNETFIVSLLQPFGGGVNLDLSAFRTTVTIVDDDLPTTNLLPAVTITGPTAAPTDSVLSSPLTVSGTADDLDGKIVDVRWATDGGASGSATFSGAPTPAHVTWSASIPLHGGPNVVTITARDNDGATATDELTVTLEGATRSYYLAEGATGSFFDFDLLLVNPNPDDVSITITFLREQGGPVTRSETLPARSRRTIRVDEISGLENTALSTVVTSTYGEPLVVERTMWWDSTGYGAHTEKAMESQAPQWYFAEGSQGFFQTYLLLANPQTAAITASVEYLREGAPAITRTYTIGAQQRLTVDASTDPALVGQSFGMVVTFSQPAAAERAMYFGGPPLFRAGHESAGVTAPSTTWFLAEGATGPFFETFVLLANPNATEASVEMTFLPSAQPPVTRTVTVPGRGRQTVNIESIDASLANEAVATRVTSSLPIVVERAQYWPDPAPQWYEAHNSFGVTTLGTRWGLAEGRVGGSAAYQTYILLANPGLIDAAVTITFLPEGGTPFSKTFTVPANRRFNVSTGPGGDVPELTGGNFGAVIDSTQPIAVERALYASSGGVLWSAGTNATGTRLPMR